MEYNVVIIIQNMKHQIRAVVHMLTSPSDQTHLDDCLTEQTAWQFPLQISCPRFGRVQTLGPGLD